MDPCGRKIVVGPAQPSQRDGKHGPNTATGRAPVNFNIKVEGTNEHEMDEFLP